MVKSGIIQWIYNSSGVTAFRADGEVFDLWFQFKNNGDEICDYTIKLYDVDTGGLIYEDYTGNVAPNDTISYYNSVIMPDHNWNIIGKLYIDSQTIPDHTLTRTIYISDYYVKIGGNNTLSGTTWNKAWKTINKAATTVVDGTTVHIGFGDYVLEPAANKIAPQNIGSLGISYLPETATTGGGTGTVSIEQNP